MAAPPYHGPLVMTEEYTGSPDDLFSLQSPMAQKFFFEEADEKRAELQLALSKLSPGERREFVETQSRFVTAILQSPKFSPGVKTVLLEDKVKLRRIELGKPDDKLASARLVEVFASPPRNVEQPEVGIRNANIVAKGIAVVVGLAALCWVAKRYFDDNAPVDLKSLENDDAAVFMDGLTHLMSVSNSSIAGTSFPTRDYLMTNVDNFKNNFKVGDAQISQYCSITRGGFVAEGVSPVSSYNATDRDATVFHIVHGNVYFDCTANLNKVPIGIWQSVVLPVIANIKALYIEPPVRVALKTSAAFLVALTAVSWQFSRDYMTEFNDPKWSLYLMGTLTLLFSVAAYDLYKMSPVENIIQFGQYATNALLKFLTGRAVAAAIAGSGLQRILSTLATSVVVASPVTALAFSLFGAVVFTGYDIWNAEANAKFDLMKMMLPFVLDFARVLAVFVLVPAATFCYRGMSNLVESGCSERSLYRGYLEEEKRESMTLEQRRAEDLKRNKEKQSASSAQAVLLKHRSDIEAAAKFLVKTGTLF